MKLRIVESDGIEIRRIKFPSDEANEYLEHEEESEYLDELNKHSIGELIVDKNTGDLIGKVFVYRTKYPGFIYNLQVEPKYRGRGFGKVLTDDAVKKFNGVDLTVKKDNYPAIKLYTKYGFEIDGDGNVYEAKKIISVNHLTNFLFCVILYITYIVGGLYGFYR